MRFNEFKKLFGSQEDVLLLNELTGGGFSWDIQHALWDDLLLRVCRMTDPPGTRKKRNVTVRIIPQFVKEKKPELLKDVQQCVNTAVQESEFARPTRNQRISHLDWDRAMGKAKPSSNATLQQVGRALDAVHAVLFRIGIEFIGIEMVNDVYVPQRAGAFLAYARQLVNSIKFLDGVIEADGDSDFTDPGVAREFLRRIGTETDMKRIRHVIELRQAARRFS